MASTFPGAMEFKDVVTFLGGVSVSGEVEAVNAGALGATDVDGYITVGGVTIAGGAGVPSGNPGVFPVVYLRSDPASASTVIYVCVATDVWAAVTVP